MAFLVPNAREAFCPLTGAWLAVIFVKVNVAGNDLTGSRVRPLGTALCEMTSGNDFAKCLKAICHVAH